MTNQTISSTPLMPWSDARFLAPVILIPLVTFLTLLLWQANARDAFRAIQLAFAWAIVGQLVFVLLRAFERGWLELFAYGMHFVAIGAASLTVTFRFEQYPLGLAYDQMALIGMAGQLMIGTLLLSSSPIKPQARLDPAVLSICAVVVCSAALIKFALYLQYVGLSGGHSGIYTEGDALRDNSPTIIRVLAAGAPLIGLLAITQPGLPRWCRALGALSIVLEFAIGIRSRPLFIILSALVLLQSGFRLTLFRKIIITFVAVFAIIALAALGYYRENNQSTAIEYLWIILISLFGVFESGVFSNQLADTAPIILTQIGPLISPTPLNSIDTIAKLLTFSFAPQAYLMGFGYSSSAMAEITMLLDIVVTGFAYPVAVFGIMLLIKTAITTRRLWLFLYGASVVPICFYIWRAELWQLALPAIKALPFIVVLLGVDAFARLGRSKLVSTKANKVRGPSFG